MRDLPAALEAELANDAHAGFAVLLEIFLDGGTIYRTTWNRRLTFQPDDDDSAHVYVPDRIVFGEVGGKLIQESPSLNLTMQNVRDPETPATTRHWSALALASSSGLNGVQVNLRLVAVGLLADGEAQIEEETWYTKAPEFRGNDIVFALGPPHNIFGLQTPEPALRQPRCRFTYKGPFCASASSLTTCPDKSIANCIGRHPETALRISQLPFDEAGALRRSV